MAYTRTYTIDANPSGDTVKVAIATKLDGDLTNIFSYLNTHEGLTTGIHGVGSGTIVGTSLTQTLTNKTLTSPALTGSIDNTNGTISGGIISSTTFTGTITASGATILSPTITAPTLVNGASTSMTLTTPTLTGSVTATGSTINIGNISGGTIASTTLSGTITASSATVIGGTLSAPTLTGTVTASGATISSPTITGAAITSSTVSGVTVAGGTNTFNIANGTASLDIAAGATLNIDKSLTVDGQATTITGAGQANTITLNESITIGDGYSGTLTYSATGKTLTVEGTSVVNQDLTTDANVQFAQVTVGNTGLVVGASTPFSDSTGTLTLQNVDAIDATTEATIEAAIDTLANLTSIQSQTVTLSGELHVEADTHVNQDLTSDATPTFAGVTTPAITAPSNNIVIKPTTDATTAVQIDDKDGNAILNVDTTNDRVGIGTTSPGYKLDVNGSIRVKDSTNSALIEADSANNFGAYLRLSEAGTKKWDILNAGGSNDILQINSASTNNVLVLQQSGNVGIGTTSPTSTLHNAGSLAMPITTKTADYTATSSDHTILCNKSDGNITITLPAVSGCSGRIYHIKKIDSSAYTVTIDANSSETIDGALTQTLTTQYESITIQNNGSAWYII